MAENGSAPSFNDRRGQNPFQPVVPASMRPKSMVAQAAQHRPMVQMTHSFGGDSYLGQGRTIPNGALPPTIFNGKTYTRDNPDVVGLRRRQVEIGERSQY